MRNLISPIVCAAVLATMVACNSSPTATSSTSATTTGSGGHAAGGAGQGGMGQGGKGQGGGVTDSIVVSPKDPSLLTCSKTTFTATVTGPADTSVTWAASAGMIDTKGLFSAPIVEGPAVTVTATSKAIPTLSASSKVTLATALPKAKLIAATTGFYADLAQHAMASSGARVYTALPVNSGAAKPGVEVLRSNDGGKTWGAPVVASPAMTDAALVSCVGVAVDPVNPDVVYVIWNFSGNSGLPAKLVAPGTDDAGGLALAVSTDGGKTFSATYALATGNSADPIPTAANICPDLVAPKADAIVVETPANANALYVFSDPARGVGFKAVNADQFNSIAKSETGGLATIAADVAQNGGNGGGLESPRLATDGAGNLCVTYKAETPAGSGSPDAQAWVQCSSDLGKTFSAPVTIGPKLLWAGDGTVSQAAIAFGPKSAVAVTWTRLNAQQPANIAASLHVAHSADGGKTFTDVTPALSNDPLLGGPTTAIQSDVRYDSDGTLWVTYVGNNHALLVDKSCDGGTTWSGSVLINAVNAALDPATLPGLVPTSTGMAVSAMGDNNQEARLYRLLP